MSDDRWLALELVAAERSGDGERTILALNAIAERLELGPDETELGLTQKASDAIDAFVKLHYDVVVEPKPVYELVLSAAAFGYLSDLIDSRYDQMLELEDEPAGLEHVRELTAAIGAAKRVEGGEVHAGA